MMSKTIKDVHRHYCDGCINFLTGQCGGAQYHIPGCIEQPLCAAVKKALKEVNNDEKEN